MDSVNLNAGHVGGNHYKKGSVKVADIVAYAAALGVDNIQHWDLAALFGWDPYQYQITKYVMRAKDKNGVQDLQKVVHFAQKYISIVEVGQAPAEWGWATLDEWGWATLEAVPSSTEHPQEDSTFRPKTLADVNFSGLVNPSSWIGYVYEGGSAEWDLYTCAHCNYKFRTNVGQAPSVVHTEHFQMKPPETEEPGPAYINQG